MNGSDAPKMDEVTPTAPASPGAMSGSRRRRRRRRRRRTSIERIRQAVTEHVELILTILLGVIVVGSLIAVGTVHVGVLLVVAPAALLSAALVWFVEEDWKRCMPGPAWVVAGLSLYSLLQSLPLPWTWLRRLSPAAAQTWADARQVIGTNVHRAASLSVDPSASRVEALKWLCYAAVFTSAAHLAKRTGAKRGLNLVVFAALAGGILTIIHGLLGLEKWLGLYEPRFARPPWALSPLLNPNNFSGYLNLAAFCAIGLAMTGRPPAPRWAVGLIAAILFALSFLTASRGGVLALLIGIVLVSIALHEQARRARRQGAPLLPGWLPIAGTALVAAILGLLGSNDIIWEQLLDETTSKLRIVEWTAPLISDYRWFGIGRGAYETAAAAYRHSTGLVIFEHAENFLADWLAEWGIPVTVLAAIALLVMLRPKRLGFLRHPLPTAAIIGIVALLLQNLVDLGLEVAAVGISAFTVMGSLWGGAARDVERRLARGATRAQGGDDTDDSPGQEFQSGPTHERPRKAHSRNARRLDVEKSKLRVQDRKSAQYAAVRSLIWTLLALGLVVTVAITGQPNATDLRDEMHGALVKVKWSDTSQVNAFRQQLTKAIERHPADPYLPLLGAVYARNTGQNALVWLNQALRRDPVNARAELFLADVLASRGHIRQALGALRHCVTHEPDLSGAVAERAERFSHSLDDLELAVPAGAAGVSLLNALALRLGKPEERALHEALLQRSFQRQGNSPATHGIVIDDLLRDIDDPKSPCAGDARAGCEARLRVHAKVIEGLGPRNILAVLMHARLLSHEGKWDEAAQWLSQRCQDFSLDGTCATHFVNTASRVKNPELLEEAAALYLAQACSTSEACANAATWIGNLFMARGNYEHALTRFERAANEGPSADAWLRVADAALRSGHVSRAQSALIAARRFGSSSDSALEHSVEQARRDQMMHDALKR